MKLPFRFLLSTLLVSVSSLTLANSLSNSVTFRVMPMVKATLQIADQNVLVSINQQPMQIVAPLNRGLWAEYSGGYIKYGDYDGDKVQELAILTSISYGGTNPCYELYDYNPTQQRFIRSNVPARCDLP